MTLFEQMMEEQISQAKDRHDQEQKIKEQVVNQQADDTQGDQDTKQAA